MSSFKPEVQTDSSGNWYGNALRFATHAEADTNVFDLMMRWTAVRDTRVTECEDPPTHTYVGGVLGPIIAPETPPCA